MTKKLVSCFALVLILSALLIPNLSASAAGNISWSVNNGVLTITGTGTIGPYGFASSRSSYMTTAPWERYQNEITSVVVGEGITYIDQLAFSELYNMTEISLPSTLNGYFLGTMGDYIYSPFHGNNLTRINWNGTTDQWIRLQSIGGSNYNTRNSANLMYNSPTVYIDGQPLTEIVLTSESPVLGYDALYNCQTLTALTVEEGYTGPIRMAFWNCPNLRTISFVDTAPEIDQNAFNGVTATVNYIPSVSWDGKVQSYGGSLAWVEQGVERHGYCGTGCEWRVMEDGTLLITGSGSIGSFDFASSRSSSMTAAPWASYGADITSVVLGEGITYIGKLAFAELYNMREITLPSTLTGYYLGYEGNQIYNAFGYNDLERVNWNGTADQWIRMQTQSGNSTYDRSQYNLMYNSPTVLMNGEPLTEAVLTADSPSVGIDAFYNCKDLGTLTVKEGYTGTIHNAFTGCSDLSNISFEGDAPEIDQNAFYGVTATVNYIPNASWEGKTLSYGGNLTWVGEGIIASGFCGSNLTWRLLEDGTLGIAGTGAMDDYTFDNRADWNLPAYRDIITSVRIEDGVTSIGSSAFYYLENLTNATIASSVETIGQQAFAECGSLTELDLTDGLKTIGSGAFYQTGLEDLQIPAGTVTIGDFAFEHCGSLVSVMLPASVSRIGDDAFRHCVTINDVSYSGSITNWASVIIGSNNETLTSCVKCSDGACGVWGSKKWTLDEEGLLVLSGTGIITDFNNSSKDAWRKYKEDIIIAELGEGITGIGSNSFSDCSGLKTIKIPAVLPASAIRLSMPALFSLMSIMAVHRMNGMLSRRELTTERLLQQQFIAFIPSLSQIILVTERSKSTRTKHGRMKLSCLP